MPKALRVSTYRFISDPDAMVGYGKLARPALQRVGWRFVARGMPGTVFEADPSSGSS